MESKYISIAKYAKMNGISKSYAYSLINQPENAIYIKESNGRRMVREDMPVDFSSIPEESTSKPEENKECAVSASIPQNSELIEYYKARIETLEAIIKEKDLQLQNNTTTIALLLERQQELTDKALQVATQAQYLQALPQKRQGFFRRLLGGGKKDV